MNSYAAALTIHPLAATAAGELTGEILDQLDGEPPDLLAVFASPHHGGAFEDIVHTLDHLLDPRALFGGTAQAIAGGPREVEAQPAISVFAARWPDAEAIPFALELIDTPDGPTVTGWPDGVDDAHTMLLFADPFSFPVDSVIRRLGDDHPDLTVIGGMASAATGAGGNHLVSGTRVTTSGAVGVLVRGDAPIRPVISQGCRGVGEPFTITASERNLIRELGGQNPLERFRAMVDGLTESERQLLRNGLNVGLMIGEDRGEFARSDYLIRGVLGADKETGTMAVAGEVEVGQVLQFHLRDAASADDDLRARLTYEQGRGALLFTCNGRGQAFFHEADHDTGVIEELLGPVPLAGAFCAGEIGPVGGRTFLHTSTASLALFG